MKWFTSIFVLNLLVLSLVPSVTAIPEINGKIDTNEWNNAESHTIELTTGIEVNFSILYTSTTAFYLAIIDHSRDVNTINLDPDKPHDYFGIEFDNNYDEAIMGTQQSPDDTIIVNYEENNAADMFMHSFKAYYDVNYGGSNDVQGIAGTDGQNLIFEIAKPFKSSDPNGHDFELVPGEEYQIMIAFWDDQKAHSATAGFNKRVDNNQFLTLTVNANSNITKVEIISTFIIVLFSLISYIIAKFGTIGIFEEIYQALIK